MTKADTPPPHHVEENATRPVGRPAKKVPTKADGERYRPEEVARIISKTSLTDLQNWRKNRK